MANKSRTAVKKWLQRQRFLRVSFSMSFAKSFMSVRPESRVRRNKIILCLRTCIRISSSYFRSKQRVCFYFRFVAFTPSILRTKRRRDEESILYIGPTINKYVCVFFFLTRVRFNMEIMYTLNYSLSDVSYLISAVFLTIPRFFYPLLSQSHKQTTSLGVLNFKR